MNYRAKFILESLNHAIKTLETHEERYGAELTTSNTLSILFLTKAELEDYFEKEECDFLSEEIPF